MSNFNYVRVETEYTNTTILFSGIESILFLGPSLYVFFTCFVHLNLFALVLENVVFVALSR